MQPLLGVVIEKVARSRMVNNVRFETSIAAEKCRHCGEDVSITDVYAELLRDLNPEVTTGNST